MLDEMQMWLESEIHKLELIRKANEEYLRKAPQGYLKIRQRSGKLEYSACIRNYQQVPGVREKTITKNKEMIEKLAYKRFCKEVIARCQWDKAILMEARDKYKAVDAISARKALPETMRKLVSEAQPDVFCRWERGLYKKRFDGQGICVHDTLKGEKVASKTEVIIANELYAAGIPYQYDCSTGIVSPSGYFYYGDFKIVLPNLKVIFWEHMGLLGDESYLKHNLEKLLNYHKGGLCIGDNLIITVDDKDGNCNSRAIHDIVRNQILPHFVTN